MNVDLAKHYQKIRKILIIVLALNWAVALTKIIYGLSSRCFSMTADGFHSLSDGTSNIIGLIGIHFACQPVDKDHPYGHKKYETLFSLGIAGMLFLVSFNLLKAGWQRLHHPILFQADWGSFAVMLITLTVNIYVMRYEYRKGRALKSDILISDSLHTRADIFTSFSVIIALVITKLGFPLIDPIVTILIALFIGYAAFAIIKQSSDVLCDTAVFLDDQKVRDIVLKTEGVLACHKIRSRGRIDDVYIDLHVQVNPSMHMDNAHQISCRIEEAIKSAIPGITDVVVHMEPQGR
ncbi:MAG: cation diffusion facilitator family transporter [Candidatus Omnitrophica bacterium]|nr:cation diffusion facilitator family transporter [Candidatus Omnitrophota bacterium]MBU4302848.1 cation diffusion facilitator family transporter [Candidatus Omnitrophota bacterium]MBU4418779.1 cation diffusion facilitator family transporter [Candidatus Omnitrophota bacterium]MBU4468723.1 cation diffusion facilitator family transporter [Candidatus Omnitrophota bacterium]MCG2707742.1 cation diffusion facilitator family transporter [Candidatus Omnitrophota bacterium]